MGPRARLLLLAVTVGGAFAILALSGTLSSERVRDWAEGSRQQVERVTDAEDRDLDPREVDWAGMDPPPARRAGRPQTGRGRGGVQVRLRMTAEERETLRARATEAGESLPAWALDRLLRAR